MSKKGTYNANFFGQFQARLHGTAIQFGYLIGTEAVDGQRHVVYAAATPELPSGDEEKQTQPDIATCLKDPSALASFVPWAQQHAKQIKPLLPGGLEPCGCFIVAPETTAKNLAAQLVPVLEGIQDPLVLVLEPMGGKLSFHLHSGGGKPSLKPAQMKADSQKDAVLFYTHTLVDVMLPHEALADEDKADSSRSSRDKELVQSVAKAVKGGLSSALAAVQVESEACRAVDATSEITIGAAVPKDCAEVEVQFLRNGSELIVLPNPEQKPMIRHRCFIVASCLFLRRDIELRHAVAQVRTAVVDSARQRMTIGLEEETDDSALLDGPLQLPWKALCKPRDCELPIWFSEYCFPDETLEAAKERMGCLLGVPQAALVEAPSYLDEHEILKANFPGTYEACKEEPGGQQRGETGTKKAAAAAGSMSMVALPCAAAVVVLALSLVLPLALRT